MARWNDVLRQTNLSKHAWVVHRSAGEGVKDWLSRQDCPTHVDNRPNEDLHRSWAFADGGVTYADGEYFTSLPRGFRVVGPLAFRAVVEGLELQPPRRWPEPLTHVSSLSDVERAPLLNDYSDGEQFQVMVNRVLGLRPLATATTGTA